jgi:hypothetical protein
MQAQTYNIITHRPVVGEPTPAPRRTKIPDTRLQHNIISNLDFSEHHHAPPEERPVVDIPPPRRLLKSAESKAEKRVYDVLTNKYVHGLACVLKLAAGMCKSPLPLAFSSSLCQLALATAGQLEVHTMAEPPNATRVKAPRQRRLQLVVMRRYKADHDAKVRLDLEAAQRDAAERFWRTRDYNPVTAGYYDVAKVRHGTHVGNNKLTFQVEVSCLSA